MTISNACNSLFTSRIQYVCEREGEGQREKYVCLFFVRQHSCRKSSYSIFNMAFGGGGGGKIAVYKILHAVEEVDKEMFFPHTSKSLSSPLK